MFAISSLGKKLLSKLKRKGYRASYVAEHVRRGVAYQIRALRDQREWDQGEFSKRLGKPQSVVCRLENPSYGKMSVHTLLEIASAFDVALQVRFVPFSAFLAHTRDVTAGSMGAASFEDEAAFSGRIELKPLSEVINTGAKNVDFAAEMPRPAITTGEETSNKGRISLTKSVDVATANFQSTLIQ